MNFIEFLKRFFWGNKLSQKALPEIVEKAELPPVKKDVWVLSIDGGGIRGIIPSFVIEKLEETLEKKGGDGHIASYFDLIAGTSTGALIALALAKQNPLTASEITELYLHKNNIFFPPAKGFLERLLKEKYSTSPIEEYLDEMYKNDTFESLTTDTLILSYDIENDNVFPMSKTITPDFPLKAALRATTAAPTFYKPMNIHYKEKDYSLIDGGVYANNPVIWAYNEAKKLFKDTGKIHILSLGNFRKKPVFNTDSGSFSWLDITKGNLPIYSLYHTAGQDSAEYLAKNIKDLDYIRIEYSSTKEEAIKMDDTSAFTLNRLSVMGKTVIEENNKLIDNIADKLITHKKSKLKFS